MRLTGKAKEQFEGWYVTNKYHEQFFLRDVHQSDCADYFEDLPKSMQWGVYQDFADSLGEYLDIERASFDDEFHTYHNQSLISEHTTRQEARNAGIKKLNELINQSK